MAPLYQLQPIMYFEVIYQTNVYENWGNALTTPNTDIPSAGVIYDRP